jgi:hypothetical protein
MPDMKTINFYRQVRVDGGKRTGVEIDGETVLERFERGNKAEDSALLWFVDIRCSGSSLPAEAEAARAWLLKMAPIIQNGVRAVAVELRAGIDFSAPISRKIPNVGKGITVEICCSAIRRLQALDMAKALDEISAHWKAFLQKLEVLEPLAR